MQPDQRAIVEPDGPTQRDNDSHQLYRNFDIAALDRTGLKPISPYQGRDEPDGDDDCAGQEKSGCKAG